MSGPGTELLLPARSFPGPRTSAVHARGRGRLRGRLTAAGAKTMTDAPLLAGGEVPDVVFVVIKCDVQVIEVVLIVHDLCLSWQWPSAFFVPRR